MPAGVLVASGGRSVEERQLGKLFASAAAPSLSVSREPPAVLRF